MHGETLKSFLFSSPIPSVSKDLAFRRVPIYNCGNLQNINLFIYLTLFLDGGRSADKLMQKKHRTKKT